MSDPTKLTLDELITGAGAVSAEVEASFGGMDSERLNWKPDPASWSIGQCLDHLIRTNTKFYPQLEELLSGKRSQTLWQNVPLIPGLWGRIMINWIRPDSSRKIKVPPGFEPSTSAIPATIVRDFISHQQEFTGLMESARPFRLEREIIYSPVSRLITYSMLDGFRIAILHEQRHLRQALRVANSPGFPKQE